MVAEDSETARGASAFRVIVLWDVIDRGDIGGTQILSCQCQHDAQSVT